MPKFKLSLPVQAGLDHTAISSWTCYCIDRRNADSAEALTQAFPCPRRCPASFSLVPIMFLHALPLAANNVKPYARELRIIRLAHPDLLGILQFAIGLLLRRRISPVPECNSTGIGSATSKKLPYRMLSPSHKDCCRRNAASTLTIKRWVKT